jgi:zinc protease
MASLKRGTATRSVEQIDRELSMLAINMTAGADLESMSMGFDALVRNMEPALNLFSDAVRHPAFDPDRFEKDKKEWLDRLKPSAMEADEFHTAAATISFGRDHPFGRFLYGTPASISAITAADAAAFYRRYFKPDIASLTFVGDVSLEDAIRMANHELGAWKGASEALPTLPSAKPVPGRVFLIERRGAPQTYIVQILPGISRNSPDFAALSLVDKVRGGMFSSRLMQKIRQEKGYAYEAGSSLWAMSGHGLWLATSPVQADRTTEALAEFVRELRDLAGSRPLTAEELATAKAHLIRGYPGQFERASSLAELISRHWASGRPMSEIRTWPDLLAGVTLDDANAVARKYAGPKKQVFLMIGDRGVAERAARELELGDVVPIAADGSAVQR